MALTYVVTGASRGLGTEFVKQLSSNGHIVIACARNPDGSEQLKKLVDNKSVYAVVLDTPDLNSVKSAAEKILEIAPQGIDVLINNAGISGDLYNPAMESLSSEFIEIFETNVVGTFNTTQALLPLLPNKSTRYIINISSELGSIEKENPGLGSPYRVSKAAENMLTKALAGQLGREGFIVVSMCPGWVVTDMGGPNADIQPDTSISGMLSVMNRMTKEANGKFINYSGKALLW